MLLCMPNTIVAGFHCTVRECAVSSGVIGFNLCQDVLFAQFDDVDSAYRFLLCLTARSGKGRVDISNYNFPAYESLVSYSQHGEL